MKKGILKVNVLVNGKKIDYLPELLRRRGVTAYKIKSEGVNSSIFTIDYNDLRKFFAICKNMCYNTKVKGYSGLLSPIAYAIKNIGVTIGIILFITVTLILDGYVFGLRFEGSGAKLKNELTLAVNEYGVNKGSKFKDINYDNLAVNLLKNNDKLKFISVYKRGNSLVINSELSNDGESVTTPLKAPLICDVVGVVESVKVLRGTAEVCVGDKVEKGSVLIGAYVLDKEDEKYPSCVLGVVTIITEESYYFESKTHTETIEKASIKKAEFLTENEVIDKKCYKTNGGYNVVLTVRKRYSGG